MSDNGNRNAFDTASKLLSTREHSREQLRRKLQQRKFTAEEIEDALNRLEKFDFLSDERFARQMVRYWSESKLRGPLEIRMRLKEAGVSSEISAEIISEFFVEDIEKDLCYKDALKKAPSIREEDKRKKYAKLYGYLSRHGYSSDAVRSAINRVLNFDTEVD